MLIQLIILIILCSTLIFSSSLVVAAIKTIAKHGRLGTFGITAFILAISTTLPELMVSIVASIEGSTSLVLGNIVGSNIANLSLVVGIAALMGGSLKVTGIILSRDIYLTGVAGFLPIFLIIDGNLSRADGVILLVVYVIMIATFLQSHHKSMAQKIMSTTPLRRLISLVRNTNGHAGIGKFLLGVALLLSSSHLIVLMAKSLAISSGLSTLFIGLFILAVGTSLPELVFVIKAVRSNQAEMAMGDLLGSVVANSTFILGISSIIRPLSLTERGLIPYGVAIGAFSALYFSFIYFVRTRKKIEWWEGLILVFGYIFFAMIEMFNK